MKNRYRLIWKAVRFLAMPYFKFRYRIKWEKCKPASKPYIVLANHNTFLDPALVGMSFLEPMRFVTSEHVFRMKFAGKLLKFMFDPIARVKGSTDVRTAAEVIKSIRSGANVCIFAEGNRSYNGETCQIPESTGKLIKRSGAGLITYRLEGGYFTEPRWGTSVRKGAMLGHPIAEYTPEQLAKLDSGEINEIIRRDLYLDAYAAQKQHPVAYKGKRLAERLEVLLHVCPVCHGISTFKSEGNQVKCAQCGLELRYNEYGFLESMQEGGPVPFDSLLDWDKWQHSYFRQMLQRWKALPADQLITSDEGQSLYELDQGSDVERMGNCTLMLFNNRLEFVEAGKKLVFALDDILDLQAHSRMTLIFSTKDKRNFEIRSRIFRSPLKYIRLVAMLKA